MAVLFPHTCCNAKKTKNMKDLSGRLDEETLGIKVLVNGKLSRFRYYYNDTLDVVTGWTYREGTAPVRAWLQVGLTGTS